MNKLIQFPRTVEATVDIDSFRRLLASNLRKLWPGSTVDVPVVNFGEPLKRALSVAAAAGHLVRGLEASAKKLDAEEHGLRLADTKAGTTRGARISRVLILSNDGATRLYRHVDTLLRTHAGRLYVLIADVDESGLGECFGGDARARAVLVTNKAAVARVLLAFAGKT